LLIILRNCFEINESPHAGRLCESRKKEVSSRQEKGPKMNSNPNGNLHLDFASSKFVRK
jgi:hypothetical protein